MHSLISSIFYIIDYIRYSSEFWKPGLMAFYTVPTAVVVAMVNYLSSWYNTTRIMVVV